MTRSGDKADVAWRVLELVSVAEVGSAEAAEAVALINAGVDVNALALPAMRHTVIPALAGFLTQHDLLRTVDTHVLANFVAVWHMNAHRTSVFVREAAQVVSMLHAEGIRVACTKGVVAQEQCYDGRGTRWISDLDIMIDPDDGPRAAKLFQDAGYRNGVRYDLKLADLVPLDRELRAVYRLYPDHLQPFFRLTGDSAFPVLSVDTALSLTWYRCGWQPPMSQVLADLDSVAVRSGADTLTLPGLDVPHSFLFLALHLFRESWFLKPVGVPKTVRLSQFADIVRHWRRYSRRQAAEIRRLAGQYGLGPAVAWICHHVDSVFGTSILAELDLAEFADEGWLASFCGVDGGWLGWHGNMAQRLRAGRDLELWSIAEPRYGAEASGGRVKGDVP